MARLPGLPARNRQEEQDVGPVGAAQARKPQTGVFQNCRAQVSANGLCVTCHEGSDGQLSAGSGWINCGGSDRMPINRGGGYKNIRYNLRAYRVEHMRPLKVCPSK